MLSENAKQTGREASPAAPAPGLTRRRYTEQFKLDAVAMLLDGHAASEIARRLGIPNTNVLYKWRDKFLALECSEEDSSTPPVPGRHTPHVREMAARLSRLEAELKKTQQERDILKKALIVFGQNE